MAEWSEYRVYPGCIIDTDVTIQPYAVVGVPSRSLRIQSAMPDQGSELLPTRIGAGCFIGCHTVVEAGAQVGARVVIEHSAVIEREVVIGEDCFVVHGARILVEARIGAGCVIGGLIADRSRVGARSRVFGSLLHRQDQLGEPWDVLVEGAPEIGNDVVVAAGAKVIGPIKIGDRVYVCANAVVTRDVPAFHVVTGMNSLVPIAAWRGRLKNSLRESSK